MKIVEKELKKSLEADTSIPIDESSQKKKFSNKDEVKRTIKRNMPMEEQISV